MAEERTLGLARAPEATDDNGDATKAELQRRMDETRESISQTVTEIKDTVVNQYHQVRETISDTLDWREQYKRHTLPMTIGAVAVGALVGYTVMGAFVGGDEDDDYDTEDALEPSESAPRSYAAAPITGAAHAAYQRAPSPEGARGEAASAQSVSAAPEPRPSYSSGYRAATAPAEAEEEEEESKGPSLYSRFKETKAYDKLQGELSSMGERVVEELSRTAQSVIVPALLSKLKSLIGIDLSTQRRVAQRSRLEQQTSEAIEGAQPDQGASANQGASKNQGASGGASANAAVSGNS
jgi:ElaB/YqjD/DUF883 family membrane-anchored ribosome-binding protein